MGFRGFARTRSWNVGIISEPVFAFISTNHAGDFFMVLTNTWVGVISPPPPPGIDAYGYKREPILKILNPITGHKKISGVQAYIEENKSITLISSVCLQRIIYTDGKLYSDITMPSKSLLGKSNVMRNNILKYILCKINIQTLHDYNFELNLESKFKSAKSQEKNQPINWY